MNRRFWSLLAVVCTCIGAADTRGAVLPHPPHCHALAGQPPCAAGPRAAAGVISLQSSQRGVRITPPGQFNFGPLPVGQQTTAQFHVRPAAAGPLVLKASLSGMNLAVPDLNSANDVGSASVNALIGRCTSAVPATAGDDRIFGTVGGELVNALAGDDLIRTGDGDDCVNGGSGNDTMAGGAGNDLLKGGPGADTISGGPGRDKIYGGPGRDRINAADGERDLVSCGAGKDSVKVDKIDELGGCERVTIAG